jgi:aspartate aminotransferase
MKNIKTLLPEGAFYIFPDISALLGKSFEGIKIETSTDFAMILLNNAHVSTTPGDAFGVPECLRLSYANSMAELEKAMDRIEKIVNEVR